MHTIRTLSEFEHLVREPASQIRFFGRERRAHGVSPFEWIGVLSIAMAALGGTLAFAT